MARTSTIIQKLAKEARIRPLVPLDWIYLNYILRDEIRWGTRGELNKPGSDTLLAIFDSRGDANKFWRLAIRAGYVVSDVQEGNVTDYEGLDYVVTITGRK